MASGKCNNIKVMQRYRGKVAEKTKELACDHRLGTTRGAEINEFSCDNR